MTNSSADQAVLLETGLLALGRDVVVDVLTLGIEPFVSSEHREFAALVDAHGGPVLGLLRRLCGNSHDADDVFQETAVRVWRHLASRPRFSNPRAWLMTVAYRAFLDYRGRQCRHRGSDAGLEAKTDERTVPPDRRAEQNEAVERLERVVAGLPEPIRDVVHLHYSGGLTLRETARALGIAEGTAKSRLNQALNELRSLLP